MTLRLAFNIKVSPLQRWPRAQLLHCCTWRVPCKWCRVPTKECLGAACHSLAPLDNGQAVRPGVEQACTPDTVQRLSGTTSHLKHDS